VPTDDTPHPWRLCIDTGGTFTDCIAIAPDGRERRIKVLSSSSLRGRVVRIDSPTRLVVAQSWDAPDGFAAGMGFRLLGSSAEPILITAFRSAGEHSIIELAAPLDPAPAAGAPFEVLSEEEPPILAARLATATPAGAPLPPISMRLATTRGTNALLERRTAEVALFTTGGLADLLAIGTQQRPDLFALRIVKPEPLPSHIIEVDERLAADGSVLRPLDLAALDGAIDDLLARGVRVAAVALLHSWKNPDHERRLAEYLRARGFTHISVSSDLAPAIKMLERTQTACVNAALAPIMEAYLGGVRRALRSGRLHVMTSGGGLVSAESFRPKDALLSGPAGGVVGAAAAARAPGFHRIITFDMGGTSTDVARFDGSHDYVFEHQVGPARVVAPAVAVESVAAGGGSICWFDHAQRLLRVGPRSAGAHPGPACYGAGGPLTVTDVNLLLGRLDPSRFEIPVDRDAAAARAQELLDELREHTGSAPPLEQLLEGLADLADEHMAEAIRAVSIRRGYDPAEHTLVAFGGAGGQHACAVAARLGITRILIPPDVGLLSAVGLRWAAIERFAERQVLRPLDDAAPTLASLIADLESEALNALAAEGVPPADAAVTRRLAQLRLVGQESSLTIDLADSPAGWAAAARAAFLQRYRAIFGYAPPPSRAIELVSVRIVASSRTEPPAAPSAAPATTTSPQPISTQEARFGGTTHPTPIYDRASLPPGAHLTGPALIVESFGTTVVPPGWDAAVDRAGALLLTAHTQTPSPRPTTTTHTPAAVADALSAARLAAIAAEMGQTLQRTALSTNVKERLDFSCAILDADGNLIVNAPHIPVHLGALGPCVRALRDAIDMGPDDVVVTNHPAFGGSHLPDITVVSPVHTASGDLIGYVASRAHHAEIGGIAPGSMPPAARCLAEEGVVIPPTHLIRRGEDRSDALRALLTSASHPSRAPDENMADLAAQAAANRLGAQALRALAESMGLPALAAAMRGLQDRAEHRLRAALRPRAGRTLRAEQHLDDGSPIRVRIDVAADGSATIDFAGSAPVHGGGFNAPAGVVRSAVIYVLRLLIDEPLPLNEGLMRAIDLRLPPGMLNPPFDPDPARCPPVSAGNVETSQRIVDTLLEAFDLASGSQGTMNNVIFGSPTFGYYETVCGGAGAGPGFDGASAVHTHMTNTRITDPEILEHRYPVRLERFAIRRGSGGDGAFRGGDGVIREYRFLAPLSLSLVTQNRVRGPRGLHGGHDGLPGRQRLTTAAGRTIDLAPTDSRPVAPGDLLTLETPGGGGWGPPPA